jgi:hypothetical protein
LQFSQELFSVKNQYFQNSIFRFIDVIAASFGQSVSLKDIKISFLRDEATIDYQQALSSYQQYIEEVRSDQQDKAAAFDDKYKYFCSCKGSGHCQINLSGVTSLWMEMAAEFMRDCWTARL